MNIQLSISLLVSDRMETLGKCLASLKPLLRELDSELIAVFTGKNEETLKLLQQYTSQIIPFTWCDDFSKARNTGLKEARGEWFLYLDDDEWFDDTAEIVHFFKSGEYQNYQCAFYVERNYLDLEGKRYSDADVGRMCRLTPETKLDNTLLDDIVQTDDRCVALFGLSGGARYFSCHFNAIASVYGNGFGGVVEFFAILVHVVVSCRSCKGDLCSAGLILFCLIYLE